MLRDFAGALWGVLLFVPATIAPGYCLGHLLNPAAFRLRGLREQAAWSVALSFGPGVLLLVAAVWLLGSQGGALFLLGFGVAAVMLVRRHPPRPDLTRRALRLAAALLGAWILLVLASLIDIGVHGRLWMSVTSYDHGLRTSFVEAVLRTGLPPVDPIYWPGHDTPMRYYYFWYAVCASVARLAHISGRQALIASCVWPLVGVVASLALFFRHMLDHRGRELMRLMSLASALMGVCGLDVLVTLALHLRHTPVLPDMEWWSMDQVSSWPDTFLWVPHHAAALVAALTGLLLVHTAARTATPDAVRARLSLAALAGLSFAAAFGMSAYVAIGSAFVVLGWLVADFCGAAPLLARRVQVLAVTTAVAAITLSGFILQLTHAEGGSRRAGRPLYLGAREVLNPARLAASLFHHTAVAHPWRAREFAAAILLVPGLGVELGFFGVVFVLALVAWGRSTGGQRLVVWLTFCGLVGANFLRSGVIASNDYGVRASLLPQFFLLLLGAVALQNAQGGSRRFLLLLTLVGATGCAYQLVLLRTYLPWQEAHGNTQVRDISERTYALRNAYAAFQSASPAAARIQFDPASTSFALYPHLLFGNRQIITAEITCSTSFGGDPAACPVLQEGILQLFPQEAAAVPHAAEAQRLCAAIGAQYLVVTRWDTAWQATSGWAWTLPATVDQPAVRIVLCASVPRS